MHTAQNQSIRKIRYSLGLSQRALAEKIGISQTSIFFAESGFRPLSEHSAKALIKLARENKIACDIIYNSRVQRSVRSK